MNQFPSTQTIHDCTLENGLRVLIYENFNTQSVVLAGSFAAGSVYEPLTHVGLASMVADGLMRGTSSHDFNALHSALEDIGAELDFSAGKYRVSVNGRALAEDLPTLLDVLADAVQNPVFPESELDEERGIRLTELNYALQDTRFMASRIFREAIYPAEHPYHYFSYGSLDSLKRITRNDLCAFHEQHYTPAGSLLVVVGAVKAADALAMVAASLGQWAKPRTIEAPALPAVQPPQTLRTVQAIIPGKTQTDLVIGTLGFERDAADYNAAAIANSILGEFGMMGRVGHHIRERLGLAYYAYSRIEAGQGVGTWHITVGVAPQNVAVAVEKVRDEVRRLTTELVTEEELDDNQSYFTGRLPLRLENNGGIASLIHTLVRYDLGLDYLLSYKERIYSITREDVLQAARHYLDADKLVIAKAGPAS